MNYKIYIYSDNPRCESELKCNDDFVKLLTSDCKNDAEAIVKAANKVLKLRDDDRSDTEYIDSLDAEKYLDDLPYTDADGFCFAIVNPSNKFVYGDKDTLKEFLGKYADTINFMVDVDSIPLEEDLVPRDVAIDYIEKELTDDNDRLWDYIGRRFKDKVKFVTDVSEIPDIQNGQRILYRFSSGKNHNLDFYSDAYRDYIYIKLPENMLNEDVEDDEIIEIEPDPDDLEAMKAIDQHEAEYGADGTRVFREVPKVNEDTIKQGNKWVNKGKEGTHGKFTTKKAADAQRKAMFAQGYKVNEDVDDSDDIISALDSLQKFNDAFLDITEDSFSIEEAFERSVNKYLVEDIGAADAIYNSYRKSIEQKYADCGEFCEAVDVFMSNAVFLPDGFSMPDKCEVIEKHFDANPPYIRIRVTAPLNAPQGISDGDSIDASDAVWRWYEDSDREDPLHAAQEEIDDILNGKYSVDSFDNEVVEDEYGGKKFKFELEDIYFEGKLKVWVNQEVADSRWEPGYIDWSVENNDFKVVAEYKITEVTE